MTCVRLDSYQKSNCVKISGALKEPRLKHIRSYLKSFVKSNWFILLLYGLLTSVVTYPIIFKLRTAIYGSPGDSWLWVWMTWWRKYSFLNGLEWRYLALNQMPFGTDHAFRPYHGLINILAIIAIPLGEIATYNILRLIGLTLAGFFTYLFVRQIVPNRAASFFAGVVFAFSAHGILHTKYHVDQAQVWIFPLFLLALINLMEKRTYRSAIILGLVFGFGAWVHAYYAYHSAVAAVVIAVVDLALVARRDSWRSVVDIRKLALYVLAGGVGVLIYLPELVSIMRDMTGTPDSPVRIAGILRRADVWFFAQGSRPWDYFLPPENHPVLGAISRRVYDTLASLQRPDFLPDVLEKQFPMLDTYWFWTSAEDPAENEQYLGYVNLVLAGLALIKWRQGKLVSRPEGQSNQGWHFWIVASLCLFLVGLLFSLPPYLPVGAVLHPVWEPLHNVIIPTLSLVTMTFVQPLRNIRRFVILMLMALGILSAMSLDYLQRNAGKPRRVVALYILVFAILGFELVNPSVVTTVTVPEEYQWLADQPDDTLTAIYPLSAREQIVFQYVHEHPLTDAIGSEDANFFKDNIYRIESMTMGEVDGANVPAKLAGMGVDYVINTGNFLEPVPEGLSLAFTTDTAQVFIVTAKPAQMTVLHTLRDGLWLSEADWNYLNPAVYVWNPLNETASVDIYIDVRDDNSELGTLSLSRELTPYPERIVWSGITIDNPYIPKNYSAGDLIVAGKEDGVYVFRGLLLAPGETTLRFSYTSDVGVENKPAVDDIRFVLHNPPDVWQIP